MNKLCPNCNFTVGPMVYMPATGGSHNVLYCMNCGWTQNITEQQAAEMNARNEDVTICDRQWKIILDFMKAVLYEFSRGPERPEYPLLLKEIRKELAAIHVRSSNPSQPSVSSLPEGSHPTGFDAKTGKPVYLDLEQDPKG